MTVENGIEIQRVDNEVGDSGLALLSIHGSTKESILAKLQENFAITGSYVQKGGQSSPVTMLSLLGAAGITTSISAGSATQLFMATASTDTLMKLGAGVGSAVMGSSRIVAQAPFIPIAGAILPVTVPLMAFQALSSITIIREFDNLNRKIDDIQALASRSIQRQEADKIGILLDLVERVESLEMQYSLGKRFTDDMYMRLALVENEVGPLFERYNYLHSNQEVSTSSTLDELQFVKLDALMSILVSILDIRSGQLRLKATIQDDPSFLPRATQLFLESISAHQKTWEGIATIPKMLKDAATQITREVNEAKGLRGKLSQVSGSAQKKTMKVETFLMESDSFEELVCSKIPDLIEESLQISQSGISSTSSLIYWLDELGEHSFYTDDLLLEAA